MSAVLIRSLAAGTIVLGLAVGLAACTTTTPEQHPPVPIRERATRAPKAAPTRARRRKPRQLVVVPGTGTYVIGVDIPLRRVPSEGRARRGQIGRMHVGDPRW